MTTYTTSYVIEGEEIPIYRHLLENWASTAKDTLLSKIKQLIQNTFDATGENVAMVEEHLRLEVVFSFWDVMDAELARVTAMRVANLDVETFTALFIQQMLLERVIDKISTTHVSSRYS